jgi:predicted phage terminase large subunit-like protein
MANLDFALHEKQLAIFTNKSRFRVVAAGRRGGKSYLSAVELLVHSLQTENEHGIDIRNKEVWYVAPTFQQGKDIIWNLLKDMGKDVIESTVENTATIKLKNGRTIKVKGSDRPDTLRGVGISFVVLDELAWMKPEVWDLIIRPTLSDVRGKALFIGTPDGKNWFHDLWVEAADPHLEDWESFHFCSLDNPVIAKEEIEAARKTMSAEAFRQEYEASFEAAGGGFFKEEDVIFADTPAHPGQIYVAYDPAGYGQDKQMLKSGLKRLDEHAIVVAEVSTSGWFIHDIVHGRWDIKEAAQKLVDVGNQYHPIAVGIEKGSLKNAIMPYLEDTMRRTNTYMRIEELTHGNKKKQERIAWALQGRFQHGQIVLKKNQKWNKHFVGQLLDFPNPLAHDDLVDALAYIDQISSVVYTSDFITDDYECLDEISGY